MDDMIYDTFYVIAPSGTPLFFQSRVPLSENEESILVAGFLSAIESFSKEAVKDEIKNIELVRNELIFRRFQDLLFVIRIKDQNAQPLLETFLQATARSFILKYGATVVSVTDVSLYNSFKEIIKNLQHEHGFHLIEPYKNKLGITPIIGLYVLSRDGTFLSSYAIKEHSFFKSFVQDIFFRYYQELQNIIKETLRRSIKSLLIKTEQNNTFLFITEKRVRILFHIKQDVNIPLINAKSSHVEAFTEVFTVLNELLSKGLNALKYGNVITTVLILDDFTIIHDLASKAPPILYRESLDPQSFLEGILK